MNTQDKGFGIPIIRRLPMYLDLLKGYGNQGQEYVSSSQLAGDLKLESIQVRKDLAATGIAGKPKLGFSIEELIISIEKYLGWDNTSDAFVVGVGNLGSALLGYRGFSLYGLQVLAGFDTDPNKVGRKINGKEIFPMAKLPGLIKRMRVHIGILTVPPDSAQKTADLMVLSGIRALWNFTSVPVLLPQEIIVENMDLAASLAVLSRKLSLVLNDH